ncbi:hypothetical protein C5S30_03620 [ANME-1 cluster archaeon GoMg4]|nr:hypothetical protein [ANME-1 cluster archaeon GoMg4]
MSDPNWFYSALAQSAAAIVGLIGAFVTSRVMMMASEKSRIEKRIQEVNAEIKELERQNTRLSKYIEEVDRKIEVEDRKEDEESLNIFLHVKKPELDLENLPTSDEMLKELREGNRINIPDEKFDSMFKEEYKALIEKIRVEKEEEVQPKHISSLGGLLAGIPLPETNLSTHLRLRSAPDPRCTKYRGIKEENNNEISYRKAKIQQLQHQGSQILLTEHFKGLILSLIYFIIVGVILPLWLPPIIPEQYLVCKTVVLFLFITGLVVVFLYIFREIKYITKKPNNA